MEKEFPYYGTKYRKRELLCQDVCRWCLSLDDVNSIYYVLLMFNRIITLCDTVLP